MNSLRRALAVFVAACIIPTGGFAQSAQLPTLEPTVVGFVFDQLLTALV